MKFQELKEKFKNKFSIRMTAGILCIALAGGGLGFSRFSAVKTESAAVGAQKADGEKKDSGVKKAEKEAEKGEEKKDGQKEDLTGRLLSMFGGKSESKESMDGKEETVYLITDAGGNVEQTIVSSWLKNGSGSAQIQDVSNLSDIENVKGEESFEQKGDQLTWQADGNDIYYRGTTQEELPVTQKLTYYLDGKEISPKELAGKSGRVTIRFDYTNHAKTTVTINGREEEIYVPFTVMSGMILDDSFRNITINNGKVLSDGNKTAAVGFAMPGLKESLDVDQKSFDEDFEFPDYVEVTADVENFSLEMTATAAMAGLLSDNDIAQNLDLSELDEKMDELTDAMGQLEDGSGELADGLGTLNDSMKTFSDGVDSLKDGVNAYTDGASALADGIQSLSDSSGTLEAGVNTLNSSAKSIRDGVQKLDQSLHTQMTEKEKAAVKQQVDQTIDAQFKKGSDTYNMIYNAAVSNFNTTITNDASVKTIQGGIQAGLQAQGLTSQGVVAALAEYYAANGFTDGSGKKYSAQVCQSNVPGTETTYAAYFASAVLNGGLSSALAGGITSGIADQGAPAVGEAVAGACRSAAKQAGETAAVSGAESAKQQIAAAIETKDAATGHSLVSGTKALSAGTQQLSDSVPVLKSGISRLLSGARELAGNNDSLKNGVTELADGTSKIRSGVEKLNDGAQQLKDGLKEFDEKAVSEIVDAYNGDVKDLTQRLKEIVKAGADYGTFSGAAKGVDTTSKFIFRTDAVKADAEEE